MRSIGLPEILVLCGAFVLIPLVALAVVYMIRSLQTKERLHAIEKGVPVPGARSDPWEKAAGNRDGGIVMIAVGLGLFILFTAVVGPGGRGPMLGVGVGAIPFLIGAGLLLTHYLRIRELGPRPPRSPGSTDRS
jgi:uncharacterized protein DUF6249